MLKLPKRIYNIPMPRYGRIEWDGYRVRIFVEEHEILRSLLAPIVPYFWDSNINLDMVANPPKNIQQTTRLSLRYKWELRDLDDKVVRSGQDSYEFESFMRRRKHGAIKIGFLKPQQCYRLNIILTDIYGNTSEPLQIASFTVKDRDEVYTQVFISLITITMGIIIGLLARGCS
jgi:hypothetical protein